MNSSPDSLNEAVVGQGQTSIPSLMFGVVAGTCLLLAGMANSEPVKVGLRQLCWDENDWKKQIPFFCYNDHFVDYEERFIHEEIPSVDYSRGGVYFMGASSMKWATKLWELPPETRPFIHNFAFGGAKHSDQGDLLRYLVQEKGLAEAGGEKTLIVFNVNYRIVHHGRLNNDGPSEYFKSHWTRHGFYSVEPDGTIHTVQGNALVKRLILERSKITGLLREIVNLIYTPLKRVRVHDANYYNQEWINGMGSNWREMITSELGYFERSIDFLQQRKIKVAVVLFPMGTWDDVLPYQPYYVKKVREICDARGVKIYDFTKLLDDDDFANSDHLDPAGIEKFQRALMGISLDHLKSAGILPADYHANKP